MSIQDLTVAGTLDEIARIGELRMPNEACGVMIDKPWRGRQVFEMPNRSLSAHLEFELSMTDVWVELQDWFKKLMNLELPDDEMFSKLTIWHTHPSGNVGPSREDLKTKKALKTSMSWLVVSMTPDGPVPTWY